MRHPISLVLKTGLALSLAAGILPSAHAQTVEGNIWYYTTPTTVSNDVKYNDIVIGRLPGGKFGNAAGDTDILTPYTVDVTAGAKNFGYGHDGQTGYYGLNAYNKATVNLNGAFVNSYANGFDNSILNLTNTTVVAASSNNNSVLNLNGSFVNTNAYGLNNGVFNLNGGSIKSASMRDASVLNVSAGNVGDALAQNASSINISGGLSGGLPLTIRGTDNAVISMTGGGNYFYTQVVSNKNSSININGGEAQYIAASDTSAVKVGAGRIYSVNGLNNSTVSVNGGEVANLSANNSSKVTISGGVVYRVSGNDTSVVNITGGTISDINAQQSSLFNLYGGVISADTIYQRSDAATFDFFGKSVVFSNPTQGTDVGNYGGVFYDTSWTQTNGNVVNTRYFDVNGNVNNATPQGIAFTKEVAGQLDISNFNRVGPDYVYGNFAGTAGTTDYRITGQASGGAGWFYNTPLDLTAHAGDSFLLSALTLPDNQADIQILLTTNDVGAANDYVYYYVIPASVFNSDGFTTGYSSALNNPAFVLDSANGYSFVGAGMTFAPNLSQVTGFQIEGLGYDATAFDYRFDQFAIANVGVTAAAPEPGTLALAMLILPSVGLILRRRR